jgi:transposase-like protein
MAETKDVAELAFDAFIESYTPKYEKAADCLSKDRDALLAFYDFRKHARKAAETLVSSADRSFDHAARAAAG